MRLHTLVSMFSIQCIVILSRTYLQHQICCNFRNLHLLCRHSFLFLLLSLFNLCAHFQFLLPLWFGFSSLQLFALSALKNNNLSTAFQLKILQKHKEDSRAAFFSLLLESLTRMKVYSIWKVVKGKCALAHVCPCRAGEIFESMS